MTTSCVNTTAGGEHFFPDDRLLPLQFYVWPPHAADEVCLGGGGREREKQWIVEVSFICDGVFSVSTSNSLCTV
jgi:hypothetical protein